MTLILHCSKYILWNLYLNCRLSLNHRVLLSHRVCHMRTSVSCLFSVWQEPVVTVSSPASGRCCRPDSLIWYFIILTDVPSTFTHLIQEMHWVQSIFDIREQLETVLCGTSSRLSLMCVYIHKCTLLKAFPGSTWKPSEFGYSAFERWPAVRSVSDSFRARKKPAPPYSVLSPLHLLFSPLLPPSFLSDVCFKVRHRSACLFPAFLQASLLLSITFICHSGSDGLSRLPHTSWRVTVCSQWYTCKNTYWGRDCEFINACTQLLCRFLFWQRTHVHNGHDRGRGVT